MTSCDDDFSLLATDHHHHHHIHQFSSHYRYATSISGDTIKVSSTGDDGGSSDNGGGGGGVFEVNPYESSEFDSVNDLNSDKRKERDDLNESTFKKTKPTSVAGAGVLVPCGGGGGGGGVFEVNPYESSDFESDKRKERDDLNESSFKKTKPFSAGVLVPCGGEYRKDREEWSDMAIECLLDAYTEKYTQLNRGNLRGRDWEEVAVIVSERCENQSKSVEQCKNKVDNLKKRYKLERHRMMSSSGGGGGVVVSHWPWFKKMEVIVGNSVGAKAGSDQEKVGGNGGGSGGVSRQQKR